MTVGELRDWKPFVQTHSYMVHVYILDVIVEIGATVQNYNIDSRSMQNIANEQVLTNSKIHLWQLSPDI